MHYKDKDNKEIVVTRGPTHSVDLCSNGISETSVVKAIIAEAKEIHSMVRNDRINSMRLEVVEPIIDYCISALQRPAASLRIV